MAWFWGGAAVSFALPRDGAALFFPPPFWRTKKQKKEKHQDDCCVFENGSSGEEFALWCEKSLGGDDMAPR